MSTRRKFFVVFCFIILNAFLLVGFLVIRDATSINKLKKEVGELSKLNILEDRYNRPIKTKGGYDLTGAKKLTFWARGAQGGEKIAEFKVGGITGEYPDTDSSSIGPIELTKEWQKYTIDLDGKDLSHIIGGFCFAASKDDNPNGFVIYFDDIIYE